MVVRKSVQQPREPAVDLVRLISEGTYTSFAQAIKEFISNAYDADATIVDIVIDEDNDQIVIRDDGVGMTSDEFLRYFASIGRSGKAGGKTIGGKTQTGRQKIGRFGIGALAVAAIAKRFTLRSSKKGRKEGFRATVDLEKLNRQYGKGKNLSDYWKFEMQNWAAEPSQEHFTEITINGPHEDVWANLLRPGERSFSDPFTTVTQLSGRDEGSVSSVQSPMKMECLFPSQI